MSEVTLTLNSPCSLQFQGFHPDSAEALNAPSQKDKDAPLPIQLYSGTICVTNLPTDLTTKVNPRDPVLNGKGKHRNRAVKDMREVLDNPDLRVYFPLFNNGIDIVVDKLFISNKNNKQIGIVGIKGILNGGHTYAELRSRLLDEVRRQNLADVSVRLNFIVGADEEQLVGIAKARNTGKALKQEDLMHMQGDFNALEKATPARLRKNINFKPGSKPYSKHAASDLIVRLHLFDVVGHPENNVGVGTGMYWAYPSKGKLLESYRSNTYEYLYGRISDILLLEDSIHQTTINLLEDPVKRRKLTAVDGKVKNTANTTISGWKLQRKVPLGLITPILSSFRMLIDENGNWKSSGKFEPKNAAEIWKLVSGEVLVQRYLAVVNSELIQYEGIPVSTVIKADKLWAACENYLLRTPYGKAVL